MSTIYNRRRGAKANKPRTPRICEWSTNSSAIHGDKTLIEQCPRLAPVNRYCEEHQK
jgi:hypothetical protein